jgi:anti-sigma regulatory factor (Ser/Thr protein kinase)
MKKILLIPFLFFCFLVQGQTNEENIEKIDRELSELPNDSLRVVYLDSVKIVYVTSSVMLKNITGKLRNIEANGSSENTKAIAKAVRADILLSMYRKYGEAEKLFLEVESYFQKKNMKKWVIGTKRNLCSLYLQNGEAEKGKKKFYELRQITGEFDKKMLVPIRSMAYASITEKSFDSAFHYINMFQHIIYQESEFSNLKYVLNNLKYTYFAYQDKLDSAIYYLTLCGEYCIISKDSINLARNFGNLGNVYMKVPNLLEARSYYRKSLKIKKKVDVGTLGYAYEGLSGTFDNESGYDSSIYYAEKALSAYNEFDDKTGVAIIQNSIAKKIAYKGNKSEYNRAIALNSKAREYFENLNAELYLEGVYQTEIVLHSKLGHYEKSKAVAERLLELVKDKELTEQKMRSYYANLSYVLLSYKLGKIGQSEVVSQVKQLTDMQADLTKAKYQNEIPRKVAELSKRRAELETQNKQLELENEQEKVKTRNYTLSGAGLFLILLLILVFYIWKQRNKTKAFNTALAIKNAETAELKSTMKHNYEANINSLKLLIPNQADFANEAYYKKASAKHQLADSLFRYKFGKVDYNTGDRSGQQTRTSFTNAVDRLLTNASEVFMQEEERVVFTAKYRTLSESLMADDEKVKIVFEILWELCRNASRHAFEGITNPEAEFTFRKSADSDRMDIFYQDNGTGIDPETTPRVVSRLSELLGAKLEFGTNEEGTFIKIHQIKLV